MSRTSEKLIRDAETARKALAKLSDALLVDLVRRAGTRATSEPKDTIVSRGKGTHSDPTMNSVIRKMSGKEISDPVWDSVREIATMLNDVASLCQSIDNRVRFITETEERVKESTIVHCQACGREVAGTVKDRIRSGYCQSCYAAWTRTGRTYRMAFEVAMRQKLQDKSQNP